MKETINDEKNKYEIIVTFSNNGKKIDEVIQSAFLKYLKYNDYK